ncbi:MAG: carboxypeptidase-like regulatory domain-containing protein [Saprospiraceae bacterium]
MKTSFYNFLLFSVFFCLGNVALAQNPTITIRGKVVESTNQNPVEFATIMVADAETGNALTGMTTDINGDFVVKTESDNFYLEISFIGFQSLTIKDFKIENNTVDLGMVELSEDSEVLEEVVVRAEKSSTEFKLDKRVFNVGKDISSTGASALEVLNNVPSVNVNIEGEISLRGSSGVQILINGKPSVLASESGNTLGTITADMIESIEVITNPSAKYDAEGTSGIINIIIKKEEREGLNGSISVNTGIPDNHSIGVSLNRRTEKFNLFSQLGAGYRSMPREEETSIPIPIPVIPF